jgi:hypothetical protein
MDELIGRLVADPGGNRATAEAAVATVFDCLVQEGPLGKAAPLRTSLPLAKASVQRAASGCSVGSNGLTYGVAPGTTGR